MTEGVIDKAMEKNWYIWENIILITFSKKVLNMCIFLN